MSYSDVVWLPNALVVTALLAAVAVWRWRAKGPLSGLRWVGVAMLPLALYAIGLWRLIWSVGLAFSRFVTGFAWRPSVWLGLLLGAVAVVLIVLPGLLGRRLGSETSRTGRPRPPAQRTNQDSGAGEDMSDIEDILRKHGIS